VNRKLFQAKSITDTRIESVVGLLAHGANRTAIIAELAEFPAKVVSSKLRQAVLKGILNGCSSDICARAGKNGCGDVYAVIPESRRKVKAVDAR